MGAASRAYALPDGFASDIGNTVGELDAEEPMQVRRQAAVEDDPICSDRFDAGVAFHTNVVVQ